MSLSGMLRMLGRICPTCRGYLSSPGSDWTIYYHFSVLWYSGNDLAKGLLENTSVLILTTNGNSCGVFRAESPVSSVQFIILLRSEGGETEIFS